MSHNVVEKSVRLSKEINEQNLYEKFLCFTKHAGNWGIDAIVIRVHVLSINDDFLLHHQTKHSTVIRGERYYFESPNIYQRYSNIEIELPNVGFFKLYNGSEYKRCTQLTLIHGGLNVATASMDDIRSRYLSAANMLLENYGIKIALFSDKETPTDPTINDIEISYTFLTKGMLPLDSRLRLMMCLANDDLPGEDKTSKQTSTKNKLIKDMSYIYSNITANKSDVLYDKDAKAESEGYLPNRKKDAAMINDMYRVYRYERKLKNACVTESLGTNSLSQLTDSMIIQYISSIIKTAEEQYISRYIKAICDANTTLLSNFLADNKNKYLSAFLINESTKGHDHHGSGILDKEAFLLLNFNFLRKESVSRSKSRLMQEASSANTKVPKMYDRMQGWIAEQILAHMYDDLHTAKYEGLGCHKSLSATTLHYYKVLDVSPTEKEMILSHTKTTFGKLKKQNSLDVLSSFVRAMITNRIHCTWKNRSSEADFPDK